MPKKLNKAGQQQEYVPSGNGDASGEYADDGGSNRHFTAFKKPEEAVKKEDETVVEENNNGGVVEEEKEEKEEKIVTEQPPKDLSKLLVNKLDKKTRQEVIKYIYGTKDSSYWTKDKILRDLRYYTGSFGDLSNFSDEELGQMIDEIQDLKFDKTDDWYYMKKGQKWLLTKDKEYQEFLGNKVYSKEEREAFEKAKSAKNLQNQNETDKEIEKVMGGSTVVCFGKGYSKEHLDSIKTATENLTNDFDGLKGYVNAMGDRTNLENYLNAVKKSRELTEEQIQNEVAKIKKWCRYYGDDVEAKYRQAAIRNLQGEVKLSRLTRAYAYWSTSDRNMIFMPKMKDAAESLKSDYENNWHPTPDEISVYYHEMGHATDYMIANKVKELKNDLRSNNWQKYEELSQIERKFHDSFRELRNQNYNEKYKEALNNAFKEKYGVRADDMNVEEILWNKKISKWSAEYQIKKELAEKGIRKYNVSEYAATNDQEFLAECFAGHYCNAKNELCEKVFNLTKEYYNRVKEFENGL